MNKNIWINTKIIEIAEEVSDRVENPSLSEFTKFVGLEYFDTGEFHITRYGSTENLVSAMKLFKKGDILFARRNAYLKRAALADFDGICSGDAIVLREKENIIRGILVLAINTDRFWQFAIANAAGTMSKRVKWRDLKNFSFRLPPLDEQQRIVALFQSLDKCIEEIENQETNLKKLWLRLIDEFVNEEPQFGNLLENRDLRPYLFKDVVNKMNRRIDPNNFDVERIVAGENLLTEDLKIRSWKIVGEDYLGPAFNMHFVPGDILYGSRRTYLKKVALANFEGVCANTTYVMKADEKFLLQDLLKHIMLSEKFTKYSIGVSKGSTNPYINWKDLDYFKFQLPDIETQRIIADILDEVLAVAEEYRAQKELLKTLKRKLLNDILG